MLVTIKRQIRSACKHKLVAARMCSSEFRWRVVTLHYAYSIPRERVTRIFGISGRTARHWYSKFKQCGHVMPGKRAITRLHALELVTFVSAYVKNYPCFYIEECQDELGAHFGAHRQGLSAFSILRLLKFDLHLSRRVIERRTREAVSREIKVFAAKLCCWYHYSE